MSYRPAFALLANARAFMESAVVYVRDGDPKQTKFAILHVATALELVLKARLAMEDPALIVRGDPVAQEAVARGEFQSVGIEEALHRLKAAGLLGLSDHQISRLKALRDMRNRGRHVVNGADAGQARAVLGAGLHLFIEIHNTGFADDEANGASSMQALVAERSRCDEFVRERHGQLAESLRTAARPRTPQLGECQHCLQDTIVIVGEYLRCLFCGASDTIRHHVECVSDDNTVGLCAACGREAVACHRNRGQESTYECICCGDSRSPQAVCGVLPSSASRAKKPS